MVEAVFFAFFASILGAALGAVSESCKSLLPALLPDNAYFRRSYSRYFGSSNFYFVSAWHHLRYIFMVPSATSRSASGARKMKFAFYLALRNLFRHPGRNVLYILGVSITAALLLDMILLSGGLKISLYVS